MSSPTWTRGALASETAPFGGTCWRVVEAQHHVSTLKLTDSLKDQDVLERAIERTKPTVPEDCRHLDFLLATPFRYDAPYPEGSRFRRAGFTKGVFYGSRTVETAIAEKVFYRLLFYAESPGLPYPADAAEYSAFRVSVRTPRAIDLTTPELSADHASWTHPTRYGPCQDLAEAGRSLGIGVILYSSVRDPGAGINVAVLTCAAFAKAAPDQRQSWRIHLSQTGARAIREFPARAIELPTATFADDPRIAPLLRH